MRSVNQAIGRVIRHKNDWASIMLVDDRYIQRRIREKLPGWIKDCLPSTASSDLEGVMSDVQDFFEHNGEKRHPGNRYDRIDKLRYAT